MIHILIDKFILHVRDVFYRGHDVHNTSLMLTTMTMTPPWYWEYVLAASAPHCIEAISRTARHARLGQVLWKSIPVGNRVCPPVPPVVVSTGASPSAPPSAQSSTTSSPTISLPWKSSHYKRSWCTESGGLAGRSNHLPIVPPAAAESGHVMWRICLLLHLFGATRARVWALSRHRTADEGWRDSTHPWRGMTGLKIFVQCDQDEADRGRGGYLHVFI